MKSVQLSLFVFVLAIMSFAMFQSKPVFYIIGDSTVKNGDGTGKNNQMGWGTMIDAWFDTTQISIRNHAMGGRSSRTFLTEGRWDKIMNELKKDDYVIMQFGHNDSGPLDDTARARGTIKGIGEDSVEIYNPIRKIKEVVHTYGWYIRKYIREAKEKGAIVIVCSPIPRDNWKDGKVIRSTDSYNQWAGQVAREEGAYFINLNELVAAKYDEMGAEAVKPFFRVDHTHTNIDGAKLNAEIIVNAIREIKPGRLQHYLLQKK